MKVIRHNRIWDLFMESQSPIADKFSSRAFWSAQSNITSPFQRQIIEIRGPVNSVILNIVSG